MVLHGRDLLMSMVDGSGHAVVIAGAKSVEINVKSDILEVSSPSSGQWREYIPTRKGWSTDITNLVMSGEWPSHKSMVGEQLTLTFTERDGNTQLSGNAIVTDWRVVGTLGNLCQGSFRFLGNGALT